MKTPMEQLLEQLAEQCCKLEWKDFVPTSLYVHRHPVAHFDRSRAETLIAAFIEEQEHKDAELLDALEELGKPETWEDAPHTTVWVVYGEPGQSLRTAIAAAAREDAGAADTEGSAG